MNPHLTIIGARRFLLLFCILAFQAITPVKAQTISFGAEVGVSAPTISLTDNTAPYNLTHVTPGFNIRLVGLRYFNNNFYVGGLVGYSLYGMDEDAIRNYLNPPQVNLLSLSVENYQNINIMARGGYKWSFKEDGIFVSPYVGVGVSAFNSASYLAKYNDPNEPYQIYKKGGSKTAFAVDFGLNAEFAVNEVIYLGAYVDYYLADFTLNEEAGAIGRLDNNYPFPLEEVTYKLRNLNGGLSIRLIL